MSMTDEIGRELKAFELTPGTIVVIAPPGHDAYLTMWVAEVDSEIVRFAAAGLPGFSGVWHIINMIRDDGELIDDQGRIVRVFEYLGEP